MVRTARQVCVCVYVCACVYLYLAVLDMCILRSHICMYVYVYIYTHTCIHKHRWGTHVHDLEGRISLIHLAFLASPVIPLSQPGYIYIYIYTHTHINTGGALTYTTQKAASRSFTWPSWHPQSSRYHNQAPHAHTAAVSSS